MSCQLPGSSDETSESLSFASIGNHEAQFAEHFVTVWTSTIPDAGGLVDPSCCNVRFAYQLSAAFNFTDCLVHESDSRFSCLLELD